MLFFSPLRLVALSGSVLEKQDLICHFTRAINLKMLWWGVCYVMITYALVT